MKKWMPYTPCKLYVDGIPSLKPGDYIRARTKGYLVQTVRPSPSLPRRRYLGCLRWPLDDIPADATAHDIFWYPRPRAKHR